MTPRPWFESFFFPNRTGQIFRYHIENIFVFTCKCALVVGLCQKMKTKNKQKQTLDTVPELINIVNSNMYKEKQGYGLDRLFIRAVKSLKTGVSQEDPVSRRMGLGRYEHKASSAFVTSGKCRGQLDSLLHLQWVPESRRRHLPPSSLNQLFSGTCRAPGQQGVAPRAPGRVLGRFPRGRCWLCHVVLVSGLFSDGGALSTPAGGPLSQAAAGEACSACRGIVRGPPRGRETQRQCFPSPLVWVTGQQPQGLGSPVSSGPGPPVTFSVTIRHLFRLDFDTWIVFPGIVGKGQILFILFYFLKKKGIERKKEKL